MGILVVVDPFGFDLVSADRISQQRFNHNINSNDIGSIEFSQNMALDYSLGEFLKDIGRL